MKLIVGLGNPGNKYTNNRHNVGFMFVDYVMESDQTKYIEKKDGDSIIFQSDELILAKPQTFMNRSGLAVRSLLKKFSLVESDLVVVHDDLDIPLGKFHIQLGVGPLLHNGLESIEQQIKSKNFTRARIGVDARLKENWVDGESYVLSNFKDKEIRLLKEAVFPKIRHSL